MKYQGLSKCFTFADYVLKISRQVILSVDRGMGFEKAMVRLQNNPGKDSSFYKSRRDMWGKTLYILATRKEGSNHLFKIAR